MWAADPSIAVTVTGYVPLGVGVRRFTVADPGVPGSAEVAVTVTAVELGSDAGAVYSPLEEMDPLALPPETAQVTLWETVWTPVVGVTTAVNC